MKLSILPTENVLVSVPTNLMLIPTNYLEKLELSQSKKHYEIVQILYSVIFLHL